MQRFASIDLGSNTVRLLIGERAAGQGLTILREERRIIRLGEGLYTDRRLLDHRMQLAVDTLNEFRGICAEYGEVFLFAAATSAVRDARNRDAFVARVLEDTGITLHVIPWEEEAQLTLDGVLWRLDLGDAPFLTFDIGGGSTEYILAQGRNVLGAAGTRLGVVRLTERFITQHPVVPDETRALEEFLNGELEQVKQQLGPVPFNTLVGTAGTVTTLAALENGIYPYDEEKIHGSVLTLAQVERWLSRLGAMTLKERLALKPLERGREDLIVVGAALARCTLRAFGCDRLTVSEYALREGLLLRAQTLAAAR